jgi:hypothetical protein
MGRGDGDGGGKEGKGRKEGIVPRSPACILTAALARSSSVRSLPLCSPFT